MKEMKEIGRQGSLIGMIRKKEDCRMKEMEDKMEARGWA